MADDRPAAAAVTAESVARAVDDLDRWIRTHGPAGSDPYDGLNSRFAPLAGLFGRWGRIAFLQAVRRLPPDLRWAAAIPPTVNAKGMALQAAAAMDLMQWRPGSIHEMRARDCLRWLDANAVRWGEGIGWGYPFDWAARAFFVPRDTPSVVVTSTVARAFLYAEVVLGDARFRERYEAAARFVLTALNRTEIGNGFCFSYTPRDRSVVVNAGLMGAALLASISRARGDNPEMLETVHRVVRFVLDDQNPDGSWFYGHAPHHRWIDGHHTGFVLRDLALIHDVTGWDELDEPLLRGLRFYADRLIAEDGRPLFRLDRPWPADIHACAEAILVFTHPGLAPRIEGATERACRVAAWTFGRLRRDDGAFGYLAWPSRTDRTPHMRWGQSWMLHALVRLERALAGAHELPGDPRGVRPAADRGPRGATIAEYNPASATRTA